jgi:hypothetical protein
MSKILVTYDEERPIVAVWLESLEDVKNHPLYDGSLRLDEEEGDEDSPDNYKRDIYCYY